MRLTASDIYQFYQPSKCAGRLDCRRLNIKEVKPSPYTEVLRELGMRHEYAHRQTLEPLLDLSQGPIQERINATMAAIESGEKIIYQPVLMSKAPFDSKIELIGIPDFLILHEGNYIVRDCKISRRINSKDHPEILEQLDLYGWLIERNIDNPPARLEVLGGDCTITNLPYQGGDTAFNTLHKVLPILQHGLNSYEPVGWTKCQSCSYIEHCWELAVKQKDIAVLPDVDQNAAITLHELGINNWDVLQTKFTPESLAEIKRPWGPRLQRIGSKASSILLQAKAFSQNKMIILQKPQLPQSENYAMFDLEGLPPQFEEAEKIYLWGIQVFGAHPSKCLQAVADFGEQGDKNGWVQFMKHAETLFNDYSDIPFVHWSPYEKTHTRKYIEKYGDINGIAERVLKNLCDLKPITENTVVLPDYSYSIKIVEKHAGYKRSMNQYGGDWSMAQYIKAIEIEDLNLKKQMIDEILEYNKEDLEATWAVLRWLRDMSLT